MTTEPRPSRLEWLSLTEALSPLRPWERELKPACRVWYWPRDVPADRGRGSSVRLDGKALAAYFPSWTLGLRAGAWGVPGPWSLPSPHLSPMTSALVVPLPQIPLLQLFWGTHMLTPMTSQPLGE